MRTRWGTTRRRAGGFLPILSIALVLAFFAPYGVGMLSTSRGSSPEAVPAVVTTVSGSAFWNGVNIDNYPAVSSAASWSFDNVANMKFDWAGPLTGVGVSQAFLVILFLGFPAYTKQQVLSSALPVGSINMTYDLTQFKWYLQGVYQLHAYLENPSGATLWSENFYVRVSQPYDLVAATVGLILLTLAELYMIVTVGPRAGDRIRSASKPASTDAPSDASGTANDSPTGKN